MNLNSFFNQAAGEAAFNIKMQRYDLAGNLPSDTDDEDFVPGEMSSSDDSNYQCNTAKKSTAKGANI